MKSLLFIKRGNQM